MSHRFGACRAHPFRVRGIAQAECSTAWSFRVMIRAEHIFMRAPRTTIALVTMLLALAGTADAQWLNYPAAGTPRLPDGKPNLSGPVARTADGHPDLSGIWNA